MTHMKVQKTPTTWRIKRKGSKFLLKSNPGKQSELSMPVSLVLKNILKYCKTTKEVKNILMQNEIIIDGKRRKDHRYPIGIMDVLSFKNSDEHFRMILNSKGKLDLVKIDKKEANIKPNKIIGKKVLGKGKFQLNLVDSRNITVNKDEFSVGDTVILKLPEQKINDTLKLKKGNAIFLFKGKNKGTIGSIEEIEGPRIKIKNNDGEIMTTNKSYAFVIGKDKPLVNISG